MIKEFNILISYEPPFPKLSVTIEKGNRNFLYCICLYILEGEETKQICKVDNFHEKGHHIHFYKKNGKEVDKQESFSFGGIGKTIDFLTDNWIKFVEERKDE